MSKTYFSLIDNYVYQDIYKYVFQDTLDRIKYIGYMADELEIFNYDIETTQYANYKAFYGLRDIGDEEEYIKYSILEEKFTDKHMKINSLISYFQYLRNEQLREDRYNIIGYYNLLHRVKNNDFDNKQFFNEIDSGSIRNRTDMYLYIDFMKRSTKDGFLVQYVNSPPVFRTLYRKILWDDVFDLHDTWVFAYFQRN